MRLDHIAYRVKDRTKTSKFFIDAFGYRIQTEFSLEFNDGSTTECMALEPPEKIPNAMLPWTYQAWFPMDDAKIPVAVKQSAGWTAGSKVVEHMQDYHLAPEIFVSDGPPGSIVGDWVDVRGAVGGIHHMAYQVKSVAATMQEWRDKGYAEFASDQPLTCPGLTQVFTKPSELTGVIYEFIERGEHGFCAENVKELMLSTKDF